jgi:hypothetical protein
MSMLQRIGTTTLVALLPFVASAPAKAQAPDDSTALNVHLIPYLWLPMVNADINHPVLGGGTASTVISTGPADYIPKLHFGAMLAGEVDYDRFSLFTDILYLSVGASGTKVTSFNSGTTAIPIDQLTTHIGTNLQSTVWTMAGGYTLAKGSWGNVDVLAGIRLLAVNDATDFDLSASVTRPDGTVALGRTGNLTTGRSLWNGIGGARGRVYVGDADWFSGGRFFIPYYFDIGGGGAHPTWQIFSGIGYQTQTIGLSVGYRYLAFDGGSDAVVKKMTLRGPILAANFSF